MFAEIITSAQNPKIKHLLQLQQKSSVRRREQLFVVEGQREIMHCVNAGYSIDTIFLCRDILDESKLSADGRSNADVDAEQLLKKASSLVEVSRNLYDRIAYRGGTEGLIALVKCRNLHLSDLCFTDKAGAKKGSNMNTAPLLVIVESVEKPGNLGAILRTADAAGADAVIVCDPLTDIYNPNLIRSSVGAFFSVPCVVCASDECISFLKSNHIQILTAQLQDSHLYYDTPMTIPTAIVMGTEATGLSQQWRCAADAHIRIPMLGQVDSLNVSVSAAILLFEAVRQRSGD